MPSSPNTSAPSSRYDAVLRFLNERINFERWNSFPSAARELKLDRMRELLDRLGPPHRDLPIIHVAGTKGKGSTAAMIGAVLGAAGYQTGLFTSPHLDRVEERIAIDGRPCPPDAFVALVDRLMPVVQAMDQEAAAQGADQIGPTYFEITTAMALLHFVEQGARAAVLEVGLGGRLDSTNVCHPRVSVITSISFDHMKQLGNTLEAIAQEKAGIIKPGVPVVSGVTDPGCQKVIREICRQRGCRLSELGYDFDFSYRPPHGLETAPSAGMLDFRCRLAGQEHVEQEIALGLVGEHQAANAAVALAVLAELKHAGWAIPSSAVHAGLSKLRWPARVEVVSRRPAIVIDAAHNRASIDALIRVLNESFSARRRLLVFATTQEKDLRGMLSRLAGQFDHVILTRYVSNPRGVPPQELAALARELTGHEYQVFPDPASAWAAIRRLATPDDLICITGSFFIAAEMRHQIRVSD